MKKHPDKFDTSNFAIDNKYGIERKNKKVPGLMKDENGGQIVQEFIGLRAQMYSYKIKRDNNPVLAKAKGVKRSAMKTITFDDYRNCLLNNINIVRTQSTIQSKKHTVMTIKLRKLALSGGDDKRILISGSTAILPWGHYSKRRRPNDDDDDDDMNDLIWKKNSK